MSNKTEMDLLDEVGEDLAHAVENSINHDSEVCQRVLLGMFLGYLHCWLEDLEIHSKVNVTDGTFVFSLYDEGKKCKAVLISGDSISSNSDLPPVLADICIKIIGETIRVADIYEIMNQSIETIALDVTLMNSFERNRDHDVIRTKKFISSIVKF